MRISHRVWDGAKQLTFKKLTRSSTRLRWYRNVCVIGITSVSINDAVAAEKMCVL